MLKMKSEAPQDLLALLESNFRAGRPLLEDAVLYRGTRLPDQTQGSYSQAHMHGSLLPQVAASYTHNWDEKTAFIGTYPVDRDKTMFYRDFGLEQALNGKKVEGYRVAEVEKSLAPLVKALAEAPTRESRMAAEANLEKSIKTFLYEAGVPTRNAQGGPNRPKDLFLYRGRPDVAFRQAVVMQMTKVGPQNERAAKEAVYAHHRNEVGQELHRLAAQPTPAAKAVRTIQAIAQKGYSDELRTAHDGKPLNEFLDAVSKQGVSPQQAQLGKFAKVLVESMGHPNKAVQAKAEAIVAQVGALDANRAGLADLVKASKVEAPTKEAAQGVARAPSVATRTAPGLDR